jgi:hypothetical protein
LILVISKNIEIIAGNKVIKDPNAKGILRNMRDKLVYIGWRTTAYGPVVITV